MNDHVYKLLELTGTSVIGIEDAVGKADRKGKQDGAQYPLVPGCMSRLRGQVADGKIAHWQVTLKVGFTLEG